MKRSWTPGRGLSAVAAVAAALVLPSTGTTAAEGPAPTEIIHRVLDTDARGLGDADLDRRDLRESTAVSRGQENVGKYACYHVELTPRRADSPYARIELWVRADNFVPLKTQMYNRAGVLLKTLVTQEIRRVEGHWF